MAVSEETKAERKQLALTLFAGLVLLASAVMVLREFLVPEESPQRAVQLVYYFDAQAGRLFADIDRVPPIDTPGGGKGQGVRAYVYSCSTCDPKDREDRRIFLEAYTLDARDVLQKELAASTPDSPRPPSPEAERLRATARLVSGFPDIHWMYANEEEGQLFLRAARDERKLCPNGKLIECHPAKQDLPTP